MNKATRLNNGYQVGFFCSEVDEIQAFISWPKYTYIIKHPKHSVIGSGLSLVAYSWDHRCTFCS